MKNLVGILSALGAINWILFGLFDWNLFEEVFRIKLLITIVYLLVGLSGIIFLGKIFKCNDCDKKSCKKCDTPEVIKDSISEN